MKAIREMRKSQKGFTLIEIMIVVLIIGILLAIAIPNFVKARTSSQTKACIANLKQIDAAEQQYAMDNKADPANIAALTTAPNNYLKSTPSCPAGGTYALGASSAANPTCTIAGHALP